jgi:hypothetical protein
VSSFTRPNGAQCAPPDDAFAIDPKSMSYSPCDWQDKRRRLDAKLHLKSKREQYMPFTSGRTGGRSWIVFMGLQGPSAVSRTTFLSMRTQSVRPRVEITAQFRSDPVREAAAICSVSEFRYHSRMVRFTEPRPRVLSIHHHAPSHTHQ